MNVRVILLVALLLSQTRLPALRVLGIPAPPPVSHVLEASDFTFDGYIRIPSSGVDGNRGSAFAHGRSVAGVAHMFIGQALSSTSPPIAPTVYELIVDQSVIGAPTSTIATAPHAQLYSKWPDVTHGHYQTYTPACGSVWSANNQAFPAKLFYNENNNLFYWLYTGNYGGATYTMTVSSLDTPSTTAGVSTLVGGPWKLTATDQYLSTVRQGNRQSDLAMGPSGQMLIGGQGYFNNDKAWGPNLYRNATWPEAGGGCPSSAFTISDHLLAFYPPTAGPTSFDGWTGVPSSQPIAQFNWPTSFLTYPYNRTTSGGGERINPQTYGIGSMGQSSSNASMVGWFNGTNKVGMIYSGAIDGAGNGVTDKTDCTNAALESYLNSGVGYAAVSSHSGTFSPNTRITGATSGARVFLSDNLLAGHEAFGWSQTVANFTVGETVTGFTSGATGTLASQSLSSPFSTLVFTAGTVVGTFTVGEYATGGTGGKQMKVTSWNAGTRTLVGNQQTVDLLPPETINAVSGGSGSLIEAHRDRVFDGGCTCTADMACATGPSSSYKTPVLMVYDPADLEAVAADTMTDYTVVPHTMIDLTKAPFSMTDLYYNLAVRGNGAGPGNAGGWIDTANLKMYLAFGKQDPVTVPLQQEPVFARFSINDSAAPTPVPLSSWLAWLMPAGLIMLFPKRRTIR